MADVLDVLVSYGDSRGDRMTRAAVMPRSNQVYRRRGDSISTGFWRACCVLIWVVIVAQEP
jgi:hypothetical protein